MRTTIKTGMLLAIIALAASCADNSEMLTAINPDGSCYRELYAKTKTDFMTGNKDEKHNPFPVELDSTWTIAWKYTGEWQTNFPLSVEEYDSLRKTAESDSIPKQFQLIIRRSYASVEEMAKLFRLKPSHTWSDLEVQYRLDKRFRWFYTYYDYSETYPEIEYPFVSIERFMAPEEAGFWLTGEPDLTEGMNGIEIKDYSDQLADKYNQWLSYNYWISLYDMLISHYEGFDLSISKEDFVSLRDTLFATTNFDDLTIDNNSFIAKRLDEYFSTDTFTSFFAADNSPATNFGDHFWNQDFMKYIENSFTYKLLMPGKILKADKAVNKNDTLIWRLSAFRMAEDDYTIQAQSRKTNVWAFIATGVIILIGIASVLRWRKGVKN